MGSIITELFKTNFMPHGHCYFWSPWVLWPTVISDVLIALSYFSIPLALIYLVRKRTKLLYHRVFLLFAGFIFACGSTHIVEIYNVWNGAYGVAAIVKIITAFFSVFTALYLIKILPQIVGLPSFEELKDLNAKLEREVSDREQAEQALVDLNNTLEEQIAIRSRELLKIEALNGAIIEASKDYAICLISPDGIISSWNPGATRVFGYSAEAALGRHFSILYPEHQLTERLPDSFSEEECENGVESFQGWREESDGKRIWIDITKCRLQDPNGILIGYSIIARNLTREKLAQQQIEEYQRELKALRPDPKA